MTIQLTNHQCEPIAAAYHTAAMREGTQKGHNNTSEALVHLSAEQAEDLWRWLGQELFGLDIGIVERPGA